MLKALFSRALQGGKSALKHLDDLMAYGPFPEPFLKQNARFAGRWRQVHGQAVIREDLRDISLLTQSRFLAAFVYRHGALGPRVLLKGVRAVPGGTRMEVDVSYVVRQTNREDNVVVPFFSGELP